MSSGGRSTDPIVYREGKVTFNTWNARRRERRTGKDQGELVLGHEALVGWEEFKIGLVSNFQQQVQQMVLPN